MFAIINIVRRRRKIMKSWWSQKTLVSKLHHYRGSKLQKACVCIFSFDPHSHFWSSVICIQTQIVLSWAFVYIFYLWSHTSVILAPSLFLCSRDSNLGNDVIEEIQAQTVGHWLYARHLSLCCSGPARTGVEPGASAWGGCEPLPERRFGANTVHRCSFVWETV